MHLQLYVVCALLVPVVLLGAPVVQAVADERQNVRLRLRKQQPVHIQRHKEAKLVVRSKCGVCRAMQCFLRPSIAQHVQKSGKRNNMIYCTWIVFHPRRSCACPRRTAAVRSKKSIVRSRQAASAYSATATQQEEIFKRQHAHYYLYDGGDAVHMLLQRQKALQKQVLLCRCVYTVLTFRCGARMLRAAIRKTTRQQTTYTTKRIDYTLHNIYLKVLEVLAVEPSQHLHVLGGELERRALEVDVEPRRVCELSARKRVVGENLSDASITAGHAHHRLAHAMQPHTSHVPPRMNPKSMCITWPSSSKRMLPLCRSFTCKKKEKFTIRNRTNI